MPASDDPWQTESCGQILSHFGGRRLVSGCGNTILPGERRFQMGALSESEVVQFYAELHAKREQKGTERFCQFLDHLFKSRDLSGCTYFTSLYTLCLVRYPPREWRYKPTLSLRIASSARVLIELRITQSTSPALRAFTESSSTPWEIGLDEFDRLYERFLAAHDSLD